jgi:hypothetical protein
MGDKNPKQQPKKKKAPSQPATATKVPASAPKTEKKK